MSGWTIYYVIIIIIKQSRRSSAAYINAFVPRRRWSNDFGRLARRAEY